MKTILYNPIFINPQAYYVFPRLTRYLQPDNESTAEPANYIGTIEVKVIAYGDTTLKRTYTNTDSIDLSEFKNTWIRISLFTKVGSCVLGEWKIGNMESDLPYIDPEVLASLKAVVIVGNKTNNDSDRAIVKNLVDPDNPFVISNAAFKLNSGFGKYGVDFTSWIQTNGVIASSDKVQNSITGRFLYFNTVNKKEDVPSFKVNITLGQQSKLQYNYIKEDGTSTYIVYSESGIYTIPASYFSKYTGGNAWFGFYQIEGTSIIEQIPSFEGAFVTDGIDDLITSTKTVQEMGITNEVTVVSMIHQIGLGRRTNFICDKGSYWRCNEVANTGEGKTGIYGYSSTNISVNTPNIINNVLGDKVDYSVTGDRNDLTPSQFSVVGYIGGSTGEISYTSSVAWYWTIIANKVLTTDQINQVIAYFNLDRTLKPDILCNTIKQGITNENHAEFGDKLIDYSGNGRDIQLNNLAWDGDSGIGKYNYPNWKVNVTQGNKYARIVYYDSINGTYSANFKGITDLYKSYGLSIEIRVNRANTIDFHSIKEDGIYTITPPDDTTSMDIRFGGEDVYNASCNITITQIPSHAGALCLDGVNDFGKVTGMPIYKDYTFISKYQRLSYREAIETEGGAVIASKSYSPNQGAFIFNGVRGDYVHDCYSFGLSSSNNLINDKNLEVYYQTKYTNQGKSISSGTAADSDILWLGTVRDNDSRFINAAIYSLMSFPYSMSEFLIERQLKKHKLGTLYPNMVEFRPIIPEDENITKIDYFVVNSGTWTIIKPGDYVDVGARIVFNIYTKLPYKVAGVSSTSFTGMSIRPSTGLNIFDVQGYIKDKTPQKIKLTLAVNEDIIQWNPTISANIPDSYDAVTEWFANGWETKIAVGDWIKKSDRIFFKLKLKEPLHEIGKVTFGGSECQATKASNWSESNNLWEIVTYSSVGDLSQVFNVQVDEYIRYEEIVQPYPVIFQITDRNTNQRYSWGDKIKVGSSIRLSQGEKTNLLSGLYSIQSYEYEGETYSYNQLTNLNIILTKKSISLSCNKTWLLDDNEPKCILSPRLLRIPNSSYKILGYIPDISGHGNHGKINNSAYAGASGANGYLQNFSGWTKASGVSSTDSVISSSNNLVAANGWIAYVTSGNVIPTFKVEISGIPVNGNLRFEGSDQVLVNGVNTIQGLTTTKVSGFYISSGYDNDWSNLKIEQIGKYEGAYCFDGVDDFVTIPTLSSGGKQVLMKVNWDKTIADAILYDQRGYPNEFAIYNADNDNSGNPVFAYQARNNGQTYIDGILNKNIKASELRAITHNITITNELQAGVNQSYAVIGSNRVNDAYFTKMALYDFMLFDEISTDDKIKELNEYVGIEGNT